jgi:subtilase family serine protease
MDMQNFRWSSHSFVSLFALVLVIGACFGSFAVIRSVSAAGAYVNVSGSYSGVPAGARMLGQAQSGSKITVTIVLKSRNETQMASVLNALYTPGNAQYHRWLAQGQFNARFAPTSTQIAQVSSYLKGQGMTIASTPSPFLVRASGTVAQVQTAFHTQINNYVASNGQRFYRNDSSVQVPSSVSDLISGVSGLTNTAYEHTHFVSTKQAAKNAGKLVPKYGAGPDGSGLVPSQIASLYGATDVYKLGSRGQGKGVTMGVFELSGYLQSDVRHYEHTFFGKSENVPLVDINVDGGPLTPVCPTGDSCNPAGDYSGDDEVTADLEQQIALAPKLDRILVYNAPNDLTGITTVNEYFKIASDDLADSISTSWGLCEQDVTLATAQAESVAFMQMAAQGQSIFAASGDSGAFDCLGDQTANDTAIAVDDPASQPYVTGVGGTSFGSFDPGKNLHPTYPQGVESVWNDLDYCNSSNPTDCEQFGAGGGGVSRFWGRPSYQKGAGVNNAYSQKGPYCSQATKGQYCREVPDVSADADEYTPYASYCTGDPATNSSCALFSGWSGAGGTSLSSPLWATIIGLWDGVHGARFGNANCGLYQLYQSNYGKYFHDITGKNQTDNNNGLYPTTPNYDLATGIGSPRISNIDQTK